MKVVSHEGPYSQMKWFTGEVIFGMFTIDSRLFTTNLKQPAPTGRQSSSNSSDPNLWGRRASLSSSDMYPKLKSPPLNLMECLPWSAEYCWGETAGVSWRSRASNGAHQFGSEYHWGVSREWIMNRNQNQKKELR